MTLGEASAAFQQQLEACRRAVELGVDMDSHRQLFEDLEKAGDVLFAVWLGDRL